MLNTQGRWLPVAFLALLSCASAAETPQPMAGDWPREFDARGSRIVVYEPQLETFRGSRLTTRAAVSLAREGAPEPVFGALWLDAVVSTDEDRRTVTPVVLKVRELRFPTLSADETARLRQDLGDEISRWNLTYSVDALLAELRLLEEQKAAAETLKADVPRILFRSGPAVLLAIQGDPAWLTSDGSAFQRLENSSAFVVRDSGSGISYLQVPPFWWTATDPLGPWQPAEAVPDAVADQSRSGARSQLPEADPGPRPEVIPVTGAAELVWTDGAPQYAPIEGTDLLYVRNTDSDVFLEIQTQTTYALFSGRWYRTPQAKNAWEFVASDRLPADFSRIPITSEKRHVLACVAGTPQAREALKDAEIPQTEAVPTGPAPDLQATYDGEPQFTDVSGLDLQYAVNTPYSIFRVPGRYYWCLDGIWYDSAFAGGPWVVCIGVPRVIYLIPPSCPHYYVTYCHIFGVTSHAVYVGCYPGYRGCYAWGGSIVYGTGWHYRPWIGTRCYTRPVTWGLGVRYSPAGGGWSIRVGFSAAPVRSPYRSSSTRTATVQAGAGGYWGGGSGHPTGVQAYRNASAAPAESPRGGNVYRRQPERVASSGAEPPSGGTPAARPPSDVPGVRTPRREPAPTTTPPPSKQPDTTRRAREPRDNPKTPPSPEREEPRTPAPRRELPKTPSRQDRDVPRTPPPQREAPKAPPQRDVPRTPPPRREVPRTPPPEQRQAPRTPPPQRRDPQQESPRSSDRSR